MGCMGPSGRNLGLGYRALGPDRMLMRRLGMNDIIFSSTGHC
jgi:hypothetical protein